MQSTAVVRQFTGIPINDNRPSQFRLSLLLRDLLAIRWHDVSDARLFGGFSTYTAVKGNWYSPGAGAMEGDDVEVSEFQFGADRTVPAIAVLLTELGLPSLVAARQSAVRFHLICPPVDIRHVTHPAAANFACELWANYPDGSGRPQAFSARADVLTSLEVILEVLDAFEGCPKVHGLTVGTEESLYAALVPKASSHQEDRFHLGLKKWLTKDFYEGQLQSKSRLGKSFINALGRQQALDLCSLRGVYAVIRLLVFAATSWFALCESDDFKVYLALKAQTGARPLSLKSKPEFLLGPLVTMLKRWTDELLGWKALRGEIMGRLQVNPFDAVLECALLTLAYTHDRIISDPEGRYRACETSRPDIFAQRETAAEHVVVESEARFWSRELRLEDNRHFPFEQTLHFWRIHEFYKTFKEQLTLPIPALQEGNVETHLESTVFKRAEELCVRRWRELTSIWVKAPADAQMMAAPFILELLAQTETLKTRRINHSLDEVQRLIKAAAYFAPSPHLWRRSLQSDS